MAVSFLWQVFVYIPYKNALSLIGFIDDDLNFIGVVHSRLLLNSHYAS